jgi:tryptophanyl-tRNA synthetase
VDVSFQYLSFFSDDDEELEQIRTGYLKGEILTGELKKKCIAKLQGFVKAYQERRAKITEEILDEFMRVRPLQWGQSRAAPASAPAENKQVEKTE